MKRKQAPDQNPESTSFRRLEKLLGSEAAQTLRAKDAVFLGQLMPITGKDLRGKKILEIGPGHGFFVELLRELGADAYGIDINEVPSQFYSSELYKKKIIRIGDATDIQKTFPGDKFAYIVSNAVLSIEGTAMSREYSTNPKTGGHFSPEEMGEAIHRAVFESLRPGGIAFHSTAEPILGDEKTLREIGYIILYKTENNLILQKPES
ncbi:Methyltransferase domain protein [Candidatus Bilamarchaeum dharawalense]|uniref:Methyltransferase domain protein n=1 Tax=Candidatus Bilamarchaeum dharawalense TaxID=2885759 RepID=A0A5E4LMR5_9ARCH|nr:Methyltransferase domain protein [Candidatus Bilamarchaeum dharawalense]